MKQTKTNSLQNALAGGDSGPHPDANVLTAFAEDALLPREREGVLAHVAHCAECRETLSLAGSAAGPHVVASSGMARGTRWRIAVPLLAAAALIAVVSTLVLRNVEKRPQQSVTVAKNAEARPDHSPPPVPAQPVSGSESPGPAKQRRALRKMAPAVIPPVAGALPAQAEAPPGEAERSEAEATRVPLAKLASPSPRAAVQAPSHVSSFANSMTTNGLTSAPANSIARPHWRINENGQPERAFGDGAWQPVLPNGSARMQTLAVFGGEVWVGGENSQVFRSPDNGTSWRVVALPAKEGTEHTIVHIRFNSAQEITVEASDGTTWSSADGGATWK